MQIGVEFADFGARQTMAERVGAVRAAAAEGFESIWVNNGLGLDGLTLLAVAGQGLQGCRIGTAVIPVYGRHPLVFAQHALTVQASLDVPLVVGLGTSHPVVTEHFYGITSAAPLRDVEEFVSALKRHFITATSGDDVAELGLNAPGTPPPAIYLAAGGPKMIDLAARLGDGILSTLTTASTYEEVILPAVAEAASAIGRNPPPVVAAEHTCVTDDPEEWFARYAPYIELLNSLERYRAVLDRQGLSTAADAMVVGDEASVRAQLRALASAGVGEYAAVVLGTPEEAERTRAVLRTFATS